MTETVLGQLGTQNVILFFLWNPNKIKYSCKSNKNAHFHENKEFETSIENTMGMILSDALNQIIKRKSKPEWKWAQFQGKKRIRSTRKLTLFDDKNTKMRIIFIYEGNGIKNRAWILSKSRWQWLFFTNEEKILRKMIQTHKWIDIFWKK